MQKLVFIRQKLVYLQSYIYCKIPNNQTKGVFICFKISMKTIQNQAICEIVIVLKNIMHA